MTPTRSNPGIRPLTSALEITCDEHRKLFEYWTERKGGKTFPTPASIDILDFPEDAKLWGITNVTRDDAGGVTFPFRFVGTSIVELVEMEPTGTELGKLKKSYSNVNFGSDIEKVYHKVLELNGPVINGPTEMPLPNDEVLHFTSLNLPMAADGTTISQILTAVSVAKRI